MPALLDVRDTLGAVLIGCFIAAALSGVVTSQTCIYFRLYSRDSTLNKLTVAFIWTMDATHTCLLCTSAWKYLIANWGNVEMHREGVVPITVALSIGVTAFITLVTHIFFLRRLLQLSKNNWFIVGPTFLIAIGRVVSALVTTVELARLQSFPAFVVKYKSVFTLGLSLSSAVDIVITIGMCYYLQESRRGFGTMDEVIDSIIVYTINNGSLTTISTIASMICWLAIPHTLIFMALHFAIAKMYANSLLATLNMRQGLRGRSGPPKERAHPSFFLSSFHRNKRRQPAQNPTLDLTTTCNDLETKGAGLHITVEKTVDYGLEEDGKSGPSSDADSPLHFQVKHADV
ncbi:hypothetical protein BJV78DRAFT_625818 [Lactifluus subvellereus]|nr:hypothetical protein BJV78DRAFT_625818 [Lactifluus subvellereus]